MFSRFFFSLLALVFLAGCHTTRSTGRSTYPHRYHKVEVTDYRGNLIAQWVAEGEVRKWDTGYRFRAVERVSAPPHVVRTRYPLARLVYIDGPNITVAPYRKPGWLVELDRGGTLAEPM
ncbi:MAG: hypothetical protein M3463_19220 [Verrucomicrobiota bacterium]|nr:hypothetical protein [Verrucomicrobiota bacterium]